MTSFELLESFMVVNGKYIMEANDVHSKQHYSMKKNMLVAIIVAATLMLMGFAYAVIKLQELSMGEYTYIQPNPFNPTEKVTVTSEFISLQGLQDSPEYQATKEWQDFLSGYDIEGAIQSQTGNDSTGFEDLSAFYQVYTQEMYDKLVEISDKYGLKLHSELNVVSSEELDYRIGCIFLGDGINRGWAYIYENGTFQMDCDTLINGEEVLLQLRRTVKGTLDEPVLNVGNVEDYQEVQYETASGETVLLAQGKDHSLIYVDFEECFILLNVLAGREIGILAETTITIEDLERMADKIDFSILKNTIKSDMRGDSAAEMETEIDDNSLFDRFLRGEISAEGNGLYSDEFFYIDALMMDEESWDAYSVGGMVDLDNDGVEEMILAGPYGGMYLDASGDSVKVFAMGDGTANSLSYIMCDGEAWIVHSDTMHSDRKYYHLQKYNGADNIVEDITLENYYSIENEATYYYNGTEVSEEEYEEIYQKYFGDGRIKAYQSVLLDICHNQVFPGGRDLGYDGYPMSDNKFAIKDIDKDGKDELIVVYITTYVGGQVEIIYDYDGTTGSVREQFIEYPGVTHFDNGILKADWSHNQGLAGRIWPYTLYQYNPEKDIYEAVAMVDAWDKTMADMDYDGNKFPDDVDKDGDLIVYYIMPPDEYGLKNPVDNDEYEKWFDAYTKDAGFSNTTTMELTEENINNLLP